MKTPKLDQALGLHEEISVVYVVDGFEASICHENDGTVIEMAQGETVHEALLNLEKVTVERIHPADAAAALGAPDDTVAWIRECADAEVTPYTRGPPFATLHRLAERLGIPPAFVRDEAEAGRLPCISRDGQGQRLFHVETVERLLTDRATTPKV